MLQEHVPMEMGGDFQPETLFEVLVHAASNAQSIDQTSKTLDASGFDGKVDCASYLETDPLRPQAVGFHGKLKTTWGMLKKVILAH